MALLHGVVQGNEKFILHPFNGQLVLLVGIIGLRDIQRGQRDAAAAHHGLTGGVEHVPAEGADVELGTQQIGGTVSVDHRFAPASVPAPTRPVQRPAVPAGRYRAGPWRSPIWRPFWR